MVHVGIFVYSLEFLSENPGNLYLKKNVRTFSYTAKNYLPCEITYYY